MTHNVKEFSRFILRAEIAVYNNNNTSNKHNVYDAGAITPVQRVRLMNWEERQAAAESPTLRSKANWVGSLSHLSAVTVGSHNFRHYSAWTLVFNGGVEFYVKRQQNT